MADKSIIEEVAEVNAIILGFKQDFAALYKRLGELDSHPSYKRVMELAAHMEAFSKGQPKPVAQAGKTRNRRTRAEIEAEKAAAANKGDK